MGKFMRNIKIYLELYGPVTTDVLHTFVDKIGYPMNSSALEKKLKKDTEILGLGYVQKQEVHNDNLDALVKFGDNYLVSNWYLHPYYFDKKGKLFPRKAVEVYHIKGLDTILKGK